MSNRIKNNKEKYFEKKIEKKYNNYVILLFFCLASIGLLFLSLSLSYFFNVSMHAQQQKLVIPPLLYINTFIILISSILLEFQRKQFKNSSLKKFLQLGTAFIVSVLCFVIFQFLIWINLSKIGFDITHNSAAFLFLISGFHILHILGGIFFFSYFIYKQWNHFSNELSSLVFFTDKSAYFKLKLFSTYWHFITIIWLGLFFLFLLVK